MTETVQAELLTQRARKSLSVAACEPGNLLHWSSRRPNKVRISSFFAETAGLLERVDFVIRANNFANGLVSGGQQSPVEATAHSDQLAFVSNCINLAVTCAE